MFTAAVVIPVASSRRQLRKLPRKNDARNASDFFNGLRFPGVDRHFWHSRTASANSVTLLAFGGTYEVMLWVRIAAPNASGAAADRRGYIRVKFKLFSFLENARRHRRHPCTSKSTTSESGRSKSSRRRCSYCASFRARKGPRS